MPSLGELRLLPGHKPSDVYIAYHRKHFVGVVDVPDIG